MSIALDASLWDEPTTGIGLYTRKLAQALEAEGVEVLRVGAASSGEHPRGNRSKTLFTLGELPRVLADVDAPLFHAVCNFNLPLTRVPGKAYVLTVHDLIPEVLPETVSRAYHWQFRLWLSRSLAIADRVVCDSEHSRGDLLERFGEGLGPEWRDELESKSVTVHLGVDHVNGLREPDAEGATYLRTLGLPKQFVLYAGALDARKNLELVLDGCERLRDAGRPVTLVLAGQRWFGAGAVERRITHLRNSGLDIRPLGYQPPEIFYALMKRATVFVFPSKYEGFGLPPLEAMALGTPAIVSTAGSLPEVCGDAAIQVDPHDAEAFANGVARLMDSPQEREERSKRGLEWSKRFTWQRAAKQMIDVYRAAES